MFGSIALGTLWAAIHTIRGEDASARRAPGEALARCLVCGEPSPADVTCPICGEPPGDRRAALTVKRNGWLDMAVAVAISGALVCLGLFIMIGAFVDGEERTWALVAFVALGLLLAGGGVLGLWGSVLVLVAALDGGASLGFRTGSPTRTARGTGASRWGKLVFLEGHARIVEPPVPGPKRAGGHRAVPGDLAFAELIATLDASGLVRLHDVTTHEWRLGSGPGERTGSTPRSRAPLALNRETTRSTQITLVLGPGSVDDSAEDPVPEHSAGETPLHTIVHYFILPWFVGSPSLEDARRVIDADPARRAQIEVHARSLAAAGVRVAPELVDVVLERLARP